MKKINLFILIIINSLITLSQTVNVTGILNDARWGHNAQVLSNGKILVMGGDNFDLQNQKVYSSAELYNPSTQTWSYTNSMNTAHDDFTSVILNNGNVMVIGGMDNNFDVIPTCEIYNVSTGIWEILSPLQTARENHASIRLLDGRVLVAGGDVEESCEIYDPYQNKWIYTGSMNILHGSGMSLTMLDNGNIIAIGGSSAPDEAEIFDPNTEKWTLLKSKLNGKYYFHSTIRLSNGRLLIAGTQITGYMKYSDLYDQNTQTFKSTGNLNVPVGSATMTLLDDGNVLLYGMGDMLNPLNTKCIQTYNVNSGIWLSNTYTFLGSLKATASKLQDGSILIVGGSRTTGNGADKICYLIKQTSFPSCNSPKLNIKVTGSLGCNGNDANIIIENSESDVKYSAIIGNSSATKGITGTNSNLQITIPQQFLSPNENIINIIADKTGCPNLVLNDTAIVDVKMPNLNKPTIYAKGPTSFCNGSSVDLAVDSVYSGYQWNSSQISSTITVKTNNTYRVRVSDKSGCYTQYSDGIVVMNYTTATAGDNQSICLKTQPFQLQGMFPVDGIWTGAGVTKQGIFNPSSLFEGIYTLNYSVCNFNVQKTMNLQKTNIKNFIINVDTLTAVTYHFGNTNFYIDSLMYIAKYEVMKDGIPLSVTHNYNNSISGNTGSIEKDTKFTIKGTYTDSCGSDTLVKSFTIKMCDNPNLVIGTHTPYVCYNKTGKIFIVNSEKGVSYTSNINGVHFNIETLKGNGDTLFFTTDPVTEDATYYIEGHSTTNSSFFMEQQVTIHVSIPRPEFTLNTNNPEIGEEILFYNTDESTKAKYSWNFGKDATLTSSDKAVPKGISYNSTGLKIITKKYIDSIGCPDEYSKFIRVINKLNNQNCNHSSISSLNELEILANTIDKDDNSILFYKDRSSSYYGDDITENWLQSPKGDLSSFTSPPNLQNKHVLVKYNAKGIIQWNAYILFNWDSNLLLIEGTLTNDSNNNIYCAYLYHTDQEESIRAYSANGLFESIYLPSAGNYVIFTKFNSFGVLQWFKVLDFSDYYSIYYCSKTVSLAVDKDENIFIATNGILQKYNTNGDLQWTKKKDFLRIIANNNRLFAYSKDIMLFKYNIDGTIIDSTLIATNNYKNGYFSATDVKLDKFGNLYFMGYFSGELHWGNSLYSTKKYEPSTTYYNTDSYIAKLDKDGNKIWFKRLQNLYGIDNIDIKDDKVAFVGSTNSVFSYNDSVDFVNPHGVFVGLTDTSSKGSINIKTIYDNSYNHTALTFAKKSNKLQLAFRLDSVLTVLGQNITVNNNKDNWIYQKNIAVMQLDYSCLFSPTKPNSKFQIITNHQCPDSVLQFVCTSSDEPKTFLWKFPGGIPSSSTERNPLVKYQKSGIYNVSLTASNDVGTYSNVQKILVDSIPVITVLPDIFCTGETDGTTITASGAKDYIWSGTLSGTGETNSMMYVFKDTTVTVTGSSPHNCFTSTKNHLIKVFKSPNVTITSSPITICENSLPIDLPTAFPKEGSYDTCKAIENGKFNPQLALIGENTLIFRYTNSNGCMDSALASITVKNCNIVDEIDSDSLISLFPNPCNQIAQIQSSLQIQSIVIFNNYGTEIFRQLFNYYIVSANIDINMSTYPKGIYLITIFTKSGKEIHRSLIKQ